MMVTLSFDVEQDCPPFASTFKGLREGLPEVMDLLEEYGIRGTFLFTGRAAEAFPELARRAAKKHELGCHGLEHERFDRLTASEAGGRLRKALSILRRFGRVVSFRAPNFQFPDGYYPVLENLGILVDSTKARHKGWRGGVTPIGGLLEVPASMTSIVTRLPWRIQLRVHEKLEEPAVYIFHPWEFVRMPRSLRPDCWFGTGKPALSKLRHLIEYHVEKDATFLTLAEYLDVYQKLKRG